jgi:predicted permease
MLLSLKLALRQLLKTPGFTATALATLAICLGANLTIFAVVDAVVVRALPFPESNRLVSIYNSYPGAGVDRSSASLPNYYDRRHVLKAVPSISIEQDSFDTVGDSSAPVRVETARISPEFFETLGVHLAMGRPFKETETAYGPDQVAILTDGYWRSHFNGDPNILGHTFMNDGIAITVIGVLKPGFRYLSSNAEFFRPMAHSKDEAAPNNRHSNNWNMIGRLAPGATIAQAQAEIDNFNTLQLKDDPYGPLVKSAGYRTTVRGLHEDHIAEARKLLLLLQAGGVFLLLIGGVNLANLFLVRISARTKELAVRQALGARPWHIARDVLVETLLVAVIGGALGIILGASGIRLIKLLGTDTLPLGSYVAFDTRVAAAGLLAAGLAGVLLALPTIWLGLHTRISSGLAAESRSGTAGRGAQGLRHGFIVVQVALAFVLLSGAGLLAVSLKQVLATPAGFTPEQVFAGAISLPWINYKDDPPREAFVRKLLPLVAGLPGVSHVAITTGLPFSGSTDDSAVIVEGAAPKTSIRAHYISAVTGDFWTAMRIPLLQGRLFTDEECRKKQRVCVVDKAFASRYWPGMSAVGKRICKDAVYKSDKTYTVVGVVANVKQNELAEVSGHGAVYFPFPSENASTNSFSLVVTTTTASPAGIGALVQKAVMEVDPALPVYKFRSMQSRIDDTLVSRRSPVILAGVFAGVALLLAAIGTYGVLSYAVAQRQREIGVRMALGAHPAQIRNQFLVLGVRLLVLGTVAGVAGSWLAGKAMQAILYNVPALQGTTLVATVFVMSAVALCACLLPAIRATKVDPVVALRGD